jgi:WD40 repeat protein
MTRVLKVLVGGIHGFLVAPLLGFILGLVSGMLTTDKPAPSILGAAIREALVFGVLLGWMTAVAGMIIVALGIILRRTALLEDGEKRAGATLSVLSKATLAVAGILAAPAMVAALWWATARGPSLTLAGHQGEVRSVAFSTDGTRLATRDSATVKLWNPATERETLSIPVDDSEFTDRLALSPDGKRLATSGRTVQVWDLATGQKLLSFAGSQSFINFSVAFSTDGRFLATGGGPVDLWDPVTGQPIRTLIGGEDRMEGLAFSPDSRHLAGAGWSGTLWVWDTATGRELLRVELGASHLHSVAFSPDRTQLATGSGDYGDFCFRPGAVTIWDAASGQKLRTMKGHWGGVNAVAYSPDGTRLVSGSGDGGLRARDPLTGRGLFRLRGHGGFGRVFSVAFSPDGKLLASAGVVVNLWDATLAR